LYPHPNSRTVCNTMAKWGVLVGLLCLVLVSNQVGLIVAQTTLQLFSQTLSGQGTYYVQSDIGTGACTLLSPTPPVGVTLQTVAMDQSLWAGSQSCGMCLEVFASGVGSGANPLKGNFTVIVTDLCPGCGLGSLDFRETTQLDGSWDIQWIAVNCPVGSGNLQYQFQGSNSYYIKLQIRNHRVPVQGVSLQVGSSFTAMSRSSDNFFILSSGGPFSTPLTIQVESIDGQQLTDTIASIGSDSQIFDGNVQFAPIGNSDGVVDGSGSDGGSDGAAGRLAAWTDLL